MSASLATIGTTARRVVAVPLPSLRLVPGHVGRAPRTAFVLMVVASLVLGLGGVLAMTTTMQERAFELYELERQVDTLKEQYAIQSSRLAGNESPAQLEKAARSLGMVPATDTVFLDLDRGRAVGSTLPEEVPLP